MSNPLPRKPRGSKKAEKELAKVQESMKQALIAREQMAKDAVENHGFTMGDAKRGVMITNGDRQTFSIDGTEICEYTEPKIAHEGKEVFGKFMFREL